MIQGDKNVLSSPPDAQVLYERYGNFQDALLSTFLVSFGYEDARAALVTLWPTVSVILLCLYNFLLIVIMLNMLITLMGDLFKTIKDKQDVSSLSVLSCPWGLNVLPCPWGLNVLSCPWADPM